MNLGHVAQQKQGRGAQVLAGVQRELPGGHCPMQGQAGHAALERKQETGCVCSMFPFHSESILRRTPKCL